MKTPDRDMNVLTKTHEKIKKGLSCCHVGDCECGRCPYENMNSCMHYLKQDALTYIQQLEMAKAERDAINKDRIDLATRLAQVERERDALLHDLRLADRVDCCVCRHNKNLPDCDGVCMTCELPCECKKCRGNDCWEWRGVCPENTKEENE